MANLEVIAHLKVRPGQLEGVKAQAAEILRVTREQDARTLRCDWFVNQDETECEVHELFTGEQGLIEHNMHMMAARATLFREYASDHRSALYGEVSQNFVDLVEARMGAAPAVFSFLQGLEPSERTSGGDTAHLEVHAHLKIRPGQLEGFTAQAAEIMRLTREQDTNTIRYDWFINAEGTECEVHEAYESGEGLIEHNAHVVEARAVLFEKYAYDHRMTAFGEVSEELMALARKHAGGLGVYSFFQGLEAVPAV
jgi:quinol monooxygenase YgiN